MDSSKQVKLTLYKALNAASNFPIDPNGNYIISFRSKVYKIQGYALGYSKVLSQLLANQKDAGISQVLVHGKDEQVVDLALKLLFGFTHVILEHNQFIQFYYVLQELGIEDAEGDFREKFAEKYLSEPNEQNVFELYEMAVNLNMYELRQKCLEFLRNREFKDILTSGNLIDTLSESALTYLFQQIFPTNSTSQRATQRVEGYCNLLFNFFQNKLRKYSQQFFVSIPENFTNLNQLQQNTRILPNHIVNELAVQQVQARSHEEWLQNFLVKVKTRERSARKKHHLNHDRLQEYNQQLEERERLMKAELQRLLASNEELQKRVAEMETREQLLKNECQQLRVDKEELQKFKILSEAISGKSSDLVRDSYENPNNWHLQINGTGKRDQELKLILGEEDKDEEGTVIVSNTQNAIRVLQSRRVPSLVVTKEWGEMEKGIVPMLKALNGSQVVNLYIERVTDEKIAHMSKLLIELKNLNTLGLDLSDTRGITDNALKSLSEGISRLTGLKNLDLNLHRWGYQNLNITDNGMKFLSTALSKLTSLTSLRLDLSRWGWNNANITDTGVDSLSDAISKLTGLTNFDLNLHRMGFMTSKITDKGVKSLSGAISNLSELNNFNLNLYRWGYQNPNITDSGIKSLSDGLIKLERLSTLTISINRSTKCHQQIKAQIAASLTSAQIAIY